MRTLIITTLIGFSPAVGCDKTQDKTGDAKSASVAGVPSDGAVRTKVDAKAAEPAPAYADVKGGSEGNTVSALKSTTMTNEPSGTAKAEDVCVCNGGDKCCCPDDMNCCNSPGTCCCESK